MLLLSIKFWAVSSRFNLPGTILSLRLALLLFVAEIVGGTVMYILLEGYSVMEGFYMTIITISTVGFTEVEPLSPSGRVFTSIFILLNIGIFAYVLAVFSYYIIEGQIFRNMQENRIRSEIAHLKNHVILCGYGKYGREITDNLLLHNEPLVIIEHSEEKIQEIANGDRHLLYVEGDATRDEVLQEAGIDRAKAVICALADDADNLFITLTARQLNPTINIISRAAEARSERKLKLAGASHIIMPEQIGGFYMATLVSKPGAIEFFGFMANEYESDISFEEILYKNLPDQFRGKPIHQLNLRRDTGVNIIGHRQATGKYLVNPGPETVLSAGESFIVLGTVNQIKELRKHISLPEV